MTTTCQNLRKEAHFAQDLIGVMQTGLDTQRNTFELLQKSFTKVIEVLELMEVKDKGVQS